MYVDIARTLIMEDEYNRDYNQFKQEEMGLNFYVEMTPAAPSVDAGDLKIEVEGDLVPDCVQCTMEIVSEPFY